MKAPGSGVPFVSVRPSPLTGAAYFPHPLPNAGQVRKFTAEKLYLSFMSLDEALSEEVVEEVSTILTETLWWVLVLQLRD